MEHMFSYCSNLKYIDLSFLDLSKVKNMNYMFANCSLLKNIQMPDMDIIYPANMAHMFENCYSLSFLNLSSFNLYKTENTENMFFNDDKLVYVNFQNAEYSNIKNTKDMFFGTLENMVFCLNETSSSQLNRIINKKGCALIDCSMEFSKNRKLINAETGQCVDRCSNPIVFFYEYKCYKKCPYGTVPIDFFCVENYDSALDVNNCTIKKFFRNQCKMNLTTPKSKQKFIEGTVNSLKNGTLYELGLEAIENKERFIIKEENEKYSLYAISNKIRENDAAYIEMDNCINTLSRLYYVSKDDFLIFKIEYTSPDFKIPIIEYSLFTQYGTRKIPLNSCRNSKINYYINRSIANYEDYIYNPLNDYYYNECSIDKKINNTVLTLQQRKKMFNANNMSLCESNCVFKRYGADTIYCICDVKIKFNSFMNVNVSKYDLISRFDIKNEININIWVIKCFLIFFSKEFILNNLFSQINLGVLFFTIICAFIFYCKEKNILFNNIKKQIMIIQAQKSKEENKPLPFLKKTMKKKYNRITKSIFKNKDKSSTKRLSLESNTFKEKKIKFKINENMKEITYSELNHLSYGDALSQDNRTFCQYYFSLIMTKNILIFTFYCKKDYNSRAIKLCLFVYIFIIHLLMNTLFITEATFNDLFITQGKIMFHYYEKIIIISVITLIIKNILLNIIFTEGNVLVVKRYKRFDEKKVLSELINLIAIKSCLFFVFNILSLTMFWAYFACFFTIFKNAKFFVIINTSITFGISLLLPICLGFIPGFIRFYSLSNRQKQNRLFSYYLSQIIQFLL